MTRLLPNPLQLLRKVVWSLILTGFATIILSWGTQAGSAQQTTYLPEGDIPIFGEVYWEGDHVVTGNLTIYKDGWLIIEEGDLFFNSSYPGQFGLTVEQGGSLDIINGQLGGNHAFRMDIRGQVYGLDTHLGALLDEGASHVSHGGLFWWDGGSLGNNLYRVDNSSFILANYTRDLEAPIVRLFNSSVTLFDSIIDNDTLVWADERPDLRRGHFLELQFLGLNGAAEPLANATLNLTRDNQTLWLGRTDPDGWVGPVGILTGRFDPELDDWTRYGSFELNLSRLDRGWVLGELELNRTATVTLKLNSSALIIDLNILPPNLGVPLHPGDRINLTVSILNSGVVDQGLAWQDDSLQVPLDMAESPYLSGHLYAIAYLRGNLSSSIFSGGINRVWHASHPVNLPPGSYMTYRYNWTVPRAIEYSFYPVLMYQVDTGDLDHLESTSNIAFTARPVVREEPTFLGLGYAYWLFILPTLVFLGLGGFGLYREYGRLGSYRVEEIFLLDDIGRVIAHSSETEGGLDEDLVGSMLTALQDFVAESFQSAGAPGRGPRGGGDADGSGGDPGSAGGPADQAPGAGEQKLKRLEHGDLMLLIEHGYHCFIVLVISGQDRSEIRQYMQTSLRDIEARFGPVLANWDGDIARFEGAAQIVEQLGSIRSGVQWKLDPRAFIAGWRERHLAGKERGGAGS